ncbi:hypothetical protein [Martelella radicis]|uniref:Uncharacterized protein n=1 Tax=Martelella radicis TaxID=1397476 RepID=A0A7W6PDL7_9HYPH|nr:hypothetical protein [Martelella radicis]MBB4124587.1 hypothetical protein [Martelella radicis]
MEIDTGIFSNLLVCSHAGWQAEQLRVQIADGFCGLLNQNLFADGKMG